MERRNRVKTMSLAKITSGRKQSFSLTKVRRIKLLCDSAEVAIAYKKLTFSANLTKSQFCSMIAFKMYIFVKS